MSKDTNAKVAALITKYAERSNQGQTAILDRAQSRVAREQVLKHYEEAKAAGMAFPATFYSELAAIYGVKASESSCRDWLKRYEAKRKAK